MNRLVSSTIAPGNVTQQCVSRVTFMLGSNIHSLYGFCQIPYVALLAFTGRSYVLGLQDFRIQQ